MMSVINNETDHTVLLDTFTIKKKRCRVFLHQWKLTWETEKAPRIQSTISLRDVISIHHQVSNGSPNRQCGRFKPNQYYFVLHFARRLHNNVWRHQRITLYHRDMQQIALWAKTIQNRLDAFSHRPKRLLLFINPYGGKKRALKIFEKHGKPLFKIANIDISVILTQRPNQIMDIILHLTLDNYDAIACVGGDGTFSEVFNGLVIRECKDKNINPNNPNCTFPPPKLPVGVIPAGSTDTVSYCIHGTNDIETTVLHIIFGESIGLDLASVYRQQNLLQLYASVVSYGYLGDVAKDSENYRWMGPKRYDYSGFKKIVNNIGYKGEIKYIDDTSDPNDVKKKCLENCERCDMKRRQRVIETRLAPPEWKTVKGKFFMVNGANVSCACSRSPNGIAPYCHIGDGCIDLVIVRHTSIFNVLRLLLRLSSRNKTICDLPFVEVYKVKEFCFRSLSNSRSNECGPRSDSCSVWNCDGEVLDVTDVRIRVHCQLLKVFSRGLQENLPESSCCFCML